MMKYPIKIFIHLLVLIFLSNNLLFAQPVKIKDAAELESALKKLNVLGSVLYIGAHPDDENTALMGYFSKGKKYRTAYLSLTRGSGGQNLIGSEKGFEIGILRTQELLQARSVDGGEQYFTRAIDFGYSKSPEETFKFWNKEEVLKDVVWVIRKFKPDVIITRFPYGSSGGHGHHTASAILAEEAFNISGDSTIYPEQLKYVKPWQAKRIFWNSWRPSDTSGLLSVNVGDYNPLLGLSYREISALSRSMHKSQGFGSSGSRGTRYEYFELIDGTPAKDNIFNGINTTWSRVKNGEVIDKELKKVINNFDPSNPSASVPALANIYDDLNKIKDGYWVNQKKKELLDIIRSAAGMWMETIAYDYSVSPGSDIYLETTLVNRSDQPFEFISIQFPTIDKDTTVNRALKNNQPETVKSRIFIPKFYPVSQPYWLQKEPSKGLFNVDDRSMIGLPENPPSVPVKITIGYKGTKLTYTLPLLFRWNDRVSGEEYRPVEIRPPVTINPVNKVSVFPDDKPKNISVTLKSDKDNLEGEVFIKSNDSWKVHPAEIPFSLKNKYDEKIVTFEVTPPKRQDDSDVKIVARVNGKEYDKSLVEISYPHIKTEVYFPGSKIKLVRLDIKTFDDNIGYIMGSGDEIPDYLSDIGYNVTLLNGNKLEETDLSKFDVIIAGIRAYNTNERIKYNQPKLMAFVKNGGTLIVQYNVTYGLLVDNIGPYRFSFSHDRITDETAKINFVDPDNFLINFPNKITEKDFEGWVQERGLYFANQWDDKYKTVFSGHDPGEKDLSGGMLYTRYGKGIFIYTGYSWFRQLPAGVPGAYRIITNLISAGHYHGQN